MSERGSEGVSEGLSSIFVKEVSVLVIMTCHQYVYVSFISNALECYCRTYDDIAGELYNYKGF